MAKRTHTLDHAPEPTRDDGAQQRERAARDDWTTWLERRLQSLHQDTLDEQVPRDMLALLREHSRR
jgi:hypothetical protein